MNCKCNYNTNPINTIWFKDLTDSRWSPTDAGFWFKDKYGAIKFVSNGMRNSENLESDLDDGHTESGKRVIKQFPPNYVKSTCYCDNVEAGIKWSEEYNKTLTMAQLANSDTISRESEFTDAPAGTKWLSKISKDSYWKKENDGNLQYYINGALFISSVHETEEWLNANRTRIDVKTEAPIGTMWKGYEDSFYIKLPEGIKYYSVFFQQWIVVSTREKDEQYLDREKGRLTV